ncbi:hypothetical protein CPC08DRAFT_715198, partial [Agrocybe pediades]
MKLSIEESSSLFSGKSRYFLTPDGRIIYKVDANVSIGSRETHIYRSFSSIGNVPSGTTADLVENGESYARIATIEFHQMSPTIFHFAAGRSCSEHELFKGGETPFGYTYHAREFIGPDGQTYVWEISSDKPKLYQMNEEVAVYDRAHLGILNPAGPPTLDIAPSVEAMSELIVITWAFVYALIEQRKRRRRRNMM